MRSLTKLGLTGATLALAVTALAAPAGAADTKGTLAFVNGVPGGRVDVCINGKELKSALPYGRAYFKNVISTGPKTLRFYKKDPRKCRGTLLAKKSIAVEPGTDLTIVVTRKAPKVVMFDNKTPAFLGEIPPKGLPYVTGIIRFNHASEIPANFFYRVWNPNPEIPLTTAANAIWTKGDSRFGDVGPDAIVQLRATRPEDSTSLAEASVRIALSHRHEWIFVGTKPANVKMVLLDRAVSQPSP